MFASVALAVLSVAFPREGATLPAVSHTYVIGAADAGCASVCVNGQIVRPYRTGAWTAFVPVSAGSNAVVVTCGADRREVRFRVAAPRGKSEGSAPARTYGKVPYAADAPSVKPARNQPCDFTVVIDAGHGGEDGGAVSPHGHLEKDFNLALARDVRAALGRLGYQVVMTRPDDSFPPLYERPRTALGVGADAFVSLHYNAPPCNRDAGKIRYQAVYAWNPLGERLARAVNARMAALSDACVNKGVLHANFAVTRNPEVPSCLVETDFLTHPAGEEAALDPVRRRRLAEAIAAGIAAFLLEDAGQA